MQTILGQGAPTMSLAGELTGSFADDVAKLVEQYAGHIDGINIAQVLQEAATKEMKQCLGGDWDCRDRAIIDMLERARREVVDEMPHASARMRHWRESLIGRGF
jgi:hypothetical protein